MVQFIGKSDIIGAYNKKFELMGFPSSNSMVNLADLLFTVLICGIAFLTFYFLALVTGKFKSFQTKLKQIMQQFRYNTIIRLVLESYLLLMISALINLHAIAFKNKLFILPCILTVITTIIFVSLPILSFVLVRRYHRSKDLK